MYWVSQGSIALCGYTPAELTCSDPNWGDVIHANDREKVWQLVQEGLDRGESFEIEYRIITHNNATKWVWERGSSVGLYNDEPLIEGFIIDITPRLHVSALIKQQNEQLARLDRLSMLGEITAGIAHEINQPLTAISTYAQSCLRFSSSENPRTDRLQEALVKLSQQAQRAGSVVERIRELSRRRPISVELVNLNQLLEIVQKLASADAHLHGIAIRTRPALAIPDILCDSVQIQLVLLNLVRNAIDSMRSVELRHGDIIILAAEKTVSGEVRIAVSDSGPGVSSEIAADLFRPFTTSRDAGLGMGLSTSRSIATACGGRLDFSNNQSAGATFVLTLQQDPGDSHDN